MGKMNGNIFLKGTKSQNSNIQNIKVPVDILVDKLTFDQSKFMISGFTCVFVVLGESVCCCV